ncbi:unnamed protein product [Protopolystoma xenopodis]|uniref:G-protein coupled receptors family 1 profile domain-containing protein n=1 Tax=Protopolystoma xenopodis TaxID=117903 RepID=A0A3S5CG71_9PLAT|nr:unnamed protein product [Protopolystoma xenopodis]
MCSDNNPQSVELFRSLSSRAPVCLTGRIFDTHIRGFKRANTLAIQSINEKITASFLNRDVYEGISASNASVCSQLGVQQCGVIKSSLHRSHGYFYPNLELERGPPNCQRRKGCCCTLKLNASYSSNWSCSNTNFPSSRLNSSSSSSSSSPSSPVSTSSSHSSFASGTPRSSTFHASSASSSPYASARFVQESRYRSYWPLGKKCLNKLSQNRPHDRHIESRHNDQRPGLARSMKNGAPINVGVKPRRPYSEKRLHRLSVHRFFRRRPITAKSTGKKSCKYIKPVEETDINGVAAQSAATQREIKDCRTVEPPAASIWRSSGSPSFVATIRMGAKRWLARHNQASRIEHLYEQLRPTVAGVTLTAAAAASIAARDRDRLEAQRERKAAGTLAIITGCFILCWLPFFIKELAQPMLAGQRLFSRTGESVLLWLGYANSLLNPIIYTIFSPEYRNAFRKILFGRYYRREGCRQW